MGEAFLKYWFVGFFLVSAAFVASFVYIKWSGCCYFIKKYLLKKESYDYKKIFEHYLTHVNSIDDKRSLYRAILQVVNELVGAEDSSLLLLDGGEYTIKESIGAKPSSFRIGGVDDFINWLAQHKKTISRTMLVNDRRFVKTKTEGLQYCVQFHCEAMVPLFVAGKLTGIINIGTRNNGEPFDSDLRELLDIVGGQSAVSINNSSLYEGMVRSNVKLRELDRLKSQLLSNISHEFRTPLNSIIGMAELIADGTDGTLNTEQKLHADMIVSSGKRLLETVTAMVDLAKLEANHLSLNVRRLNLGKVIQKIADGVKPSENTQLKVELKDVPPVYGDEALLEKLFSHLLGNAVKYTPNGEIIVDAERSGEMLKVSVKDTGVGIDEKKREEVFEGFSQGEIGVNRPYEGSGLGLAISKKVVELHGGRIWFSSSVGKGSHFHFTLPLKPITVKSVELKQVA